MTRRLAWKTLKFHRHAMWRNLAIAYAFGIGWMLDHALWSPPATAMPLRGGLMLTVPALLAVIGYAGWRQHREYPEGIVLPKLLGILAGTAGGGIALYLMAEPLAFHPLARILLTGFTLAMLSLFLKNMAAIFLFSRKDIP